MVCVGLLFASLIFCYGCQEAPVAVTGGDLYMPLKVGNTWKYSQNDGSIRILTVTGAMTVAGNTCYIIRNSTASSTSEALGYNDANGNWSYGTPTSPLTTPQLSIPYPLSVGKTWTASGSTFECRASEDITLSNGTTYTSCWKFRNFWPSGTYNDDWIKENVGLVKRITVGSSTTSTYELVEVVLP